MSPYVKDSKFQEISRFPTKAQVGLSYLFFFVLLSYSSLGQASAISFCTNLLSSKVAPLFRTLSKAQEAETSALNNYLVNLAGDEEAHRQNFPHLQTKFHLETLSYLRKHSFQLSRNSSVDLVRRRLAESLANKIAEMGANSILDRIDFLAASKIFVLLFTPASDAHRRNMNLFDEESSSLSLDRNPKRSWVLWFDREVRLGSDFSRIWQQTRQNTLEQQVPGQLRFPNHLLNSVEDFEFFWDEEVAPILTRHKTEFVDGVYMDSHAQASHDETHASVSRNLDSRRLTAKAGQRIRKLIQETEDHKTKLGIRLIRWVLNHEFNITAEEVKTLALHGEVHTASGFFRAQHVIVHAEEQLKRGLFPNIRKKDFQDIATRGYEALTQAYLKMEFL